MRCYDNSFLCPVCGNSVEEYDVCKVCNWENTGTTNIDGGPDKVTLKRAIEGFKNGKPIE